MILIVGATGNIGRALVKLLSEADLPLRLLLRDGSQAERLPSQIEFAKGDLADPDSLDKALTGIDKAFLVSSPAENVADLHGNFFRRQSAAA